MHKRMPAILIQYASNGNSSKPPAYHVTIDDVFTTPSRGTANWITGRQLARDCGGVVAVMYLAHTRRAEQQDSTQKKVT